MPDPEAIRYRAFLSYCHADTAEAKTVHRRIETFRFDRDLVGRDTPMGPVPRSLRPVFRDRHDFEAGSIFQNETLVALDASAALVVLCSPASAKSRAVNEEIRLFRCRHPERPVVPIMLKGDAGTSGQAYFPPALRFEIASDGSVSDRPQVVLAADIRATGDGYDLALAKVIARLSGLAPDEIYRRAERERRRQARITTAIAAVIGVLSIMGGFAFWLSNEKQRTLAEIEKLVGQFSLINPAQAAVPGAKESLTEAIKALAKGAATDPRYAKALDLLKVSKPAEAMPLMESAADDEAERGAKLNRAAAQKFRHIGAIAGFADPKRAREAYRRAVALDPGNVESLYWYGTFELSAGNVDIAEANLRSLLTLPTLDAERPERIWAELMIGEIHRARGRLGDAVASFQSMRSTIERLDRKEPANRIWTNALGAVNGSLGDLMVEQGRFSEAAEFFKESFAIRRRQFAADGHDDNLRDEVAESASRLGDAFLAQGQFEDALKVYRSSLEIRTALAVERPDDATTQSTLAHAHLKAADALVALKQLPEAMASYRTQLEIFDRLMRIDPNNVYWQNGVAVVHERIGYLRQDEGNHSAALAEFETMRRIMQSIADAHPEEARVQRNLSVTFVDFGDAFMSQGNRAEALAKYKEAVLLRERLVALDRTNANWQWDLAVAYDRVASVERALGHAGEADRQHVRAASVYDAMLRENADNAFFLVSKTLKVLRLGAFDPDWRQGHVQQAIEVLKALDAAGRIESRQKDLLARLRKMPP